MGSGGVGKSAITIRFVNRQFEAKVMFFELITLLPIRNWRNYPPSYLSAHSFINNERIVLVAKDDYLDTFQQL